MDIFAISYIIGAVLLSVTELGAVARRQRGDTLTEKVRRMPLAHSAISGLVTWAVYHFVVIEWTPGTINHPATDVLIALAGTAGGYGAHLQRKKKEEGR